MKNKIKLLPFIFLIALAGFGLYAHWFDALSFESLKRHHQLLLQWQQEHFWWVVLGFMTIYIVTVATSIPIPGATFLTLTAGFLFGPYLGTLLTVISATIGAYLIFIAVELAFREWFAQKAKGWIKSMEVGLRNNAFSYLLFLRLVPLFPFFIVNIVPALLGVNRKTFFITTLIGIIPGSFVYVLLGNGLGRVFDQGAALNLKIIWDPQVLLPLLGLSLLSLAPVLYKRLKRKKHDHTNL